MVSDRRGRGGVGRPGSGHGSGVPGARGLLRRRVAGPGLRPPGAGPGLKTELESRLVCPRAPSRICAECGRGFTRPRTEERSPNRGLQFLRTTDRNIRQQITTYVAATSCVCHVMCLHARLGPPRHLHRGRVMTNVWTGVARPSHRQGIIWDGIGRHASMLVCRRLQGIIWDGIRAA